MQKIKFVFAAFAAVLLVVGIALTPRPFAWAGGTGVNHDVIKTVSTSISSEATVATPATGKTLVVRGFSLESSGAGIVVFKDNTAGTTILNYYLPATTNRDLSPVLLGHGLRLSAADHVLTATLSGATLTGFFLCDEE